MGTSTDAMLMYGVPLDEDTDLSYDEDVDTQQSGPAFMNFMGKAEGGIEIVEHCSKDCTMYFAIIEGTLVRAWRGYPMKVETPKPEASWNKRLAAFCKKHGLSAGKPAWYIASMWD